MPEKANRNSFHPIRLLFADDERGYADVLTNRLMRRGIDVVKCYSGADAIRAMRGADFHVALLDLKMDDMDGIEVLRILKKMDPDIEVIMLTGHGSEEAAMEGMRSGAMDYLTKPCEIEEILEKIQSACRQRRQRLYPDAGSAPDY